MQYKTIQGDTWDMAAYKSLGDENETSRLIMANSQIADTVIFSAGVILNVPDTVSKESTNIPPWRR